MCIPVYVQHAIVIYKCSEEGPCLLVVIVFVFVVVVAVVFIAAPSKLVLDELAPVASQITTTHWLHD